MQISTFCLFVKIVTVFSNNVYYPYKPYNRWVLQRYLPMPMYSYSHRINLVGTENLNDQNNNVATQSQNVIGLYDGNNQDTKTSLIKNVHLNLGGQISDIGNEEKTLEGENDINANLNVLNSQNTLNSWNKLSTNGHYVENSLGGYVNPINTLQLSNLRETNTHYIPNYSGYIYNSNAKPIIDFEDKTRNGDIYGSYRNDVSSQVYGKDREAQEINTSVDSRSNKHIANAFHPKDVADTKNIEEYNDFAHIMTGINTSQENKESPITVTADDNQEDNNETDKTENVTAEIKEAGSDDILETRIDNNAVKNTPCSLINNLIKPIETIEPKKLELERNSNGYDTRLLNDAHGKHDLFTLNRGFCVHKCFTICH